MLARVQTLLFLYRFAYICTSDIPFNSFDRIKLRPCKVAEVFTHHYTALHTIAQKKEVSVFYTKRQQLIVQIC